MDGYTTRPGQSILKYFPRRSFLIARCHTTKRLSHGGMNPWRNTSTGKTRTPITMVSTPYSAWTTLQILDLQHSKKPTPTDGKPQRSSSYHHDPPPSQREKKTKESPKATLSKTDQNVHRNTKPHSRPPFLLKKLLPKPQKTFYGHQVGILVTPNLEITKTRQSSAISGEEYNILVHLVGCL